MFLALGQSNGVSDLLFRLSFANDSQNNNETCNINLLFEKDVQDRSESNFRTNLKGNLVLSFWN